jgi:hypothetical protein
MKPLAAILPLPLVLSLAACLAASAQQPNPPAPAATQGPSAQTQPAQTQPAPQQPSSLTTVLNESAPPPSPAASQSSIATVSLEGVSLSGSLSVENGLAFIGNNGAITAGDKTAHVALTRGGALNVCASTKIQLSTDNTISGGGLMIAIDHGALEAHYLPGQYSDVLLTPDLRILISGPGEANLSFRVNNQGDTCVDNHGDRAPYVLASSLFEGGAYRIQPNQRVLFEHGSLQQVVDNESEPCGCPLLPPIPAPASIASVGIPGATLRSSDKGTSAPPPPAATTAAQNPFPLAESEGLQPPPPPPNTPVVPPGEAHIQVTVPLVYNGETSQNIGMPASSLSAPAPSSGSAPAPASNAACSDPLYPGVVCDSAATADQAKGQPENSPTTAQTAQTAKAKKKSSGFAHFLRKIFGGG